MLTITKNPTGGYRLTSELLLPAPRDEVFAFFADARQLETITPPWLHFHVLTEPPITLGEGAVIDYRLRLRGIPLRWRSKISGWNPPFGFVDEQLRGPYRWWRHEHTFTEQDGQTLVGDKVDYGVPGGALVHQLIVCRDVEQIFGFRIARLREIFAGERCAT